LKPPKKNNKWNYNCKNLKVLSQLKRKTNLETKQNGEYKKKWDTYLCIWNGILMPHNLHTIFPMNKSFFHSKPLSILLNKMFFPISNQFINN
jgi:hypothetical protein